MESPPTIQKQLSDAIGIISKYDFPEKWPQLFDEMVAQFKTGDIHTINCVLETVHIIVKRYRYECESQALWEEIEFLVNKFSEPLTKLLMNVMNRTKNHKDTCKTLPFLYGTIALVSKIFYSLNAQDLPEFFEVNMATWMKAFHILLMNDIQCLRTKVCIRKRKSWFFSKTFDHSWNFIYISTVV